MYRTHTCGELRIAQQGEQIQLSGWVQRVRNLGGMTFVDLRDRYGITQVVFNMDTDADLCTQARKLGREYVIQVSGQVAERSNKNPAIPTGEIEILADSFTILNPSAIPPFTIEEETDGGEDLRMQYRYLDLRRPPLQQKLWLRHRLYQATRGYLDDHNFLEVETPVLVKSTPEGARDFVVPSRLHEGEFYALPQSPQTFKQLLMVGGLDKYFQIVKCFRDEDLRADRQPEFTQIDCEMAFVEQEDILQTFEGLLRHLLYHIKNDDPGEFPRMSWHEAMERFGTDKPDIRFGMELTNLNEEAKDKGFKVFDNAELVVGINAEGCGHYTRKQLDELTEWVQRPQIGANGLVYVKCNDDGSFKSSVDKFFSQDDLSAWAEQCGAKPGDLLLILAGDQEHTQNAAGELRLEMGRRLDLRNPNEFQPLWVLDFPLLEWDEDEKRWAARHHPFTSPVDEDIPKLDTDPGAVRANAYDLVLNGNEIAGGSIRIHNRDVQSQIFDALGMSREEADKKFGFLMRAFEYGAPPHGGIAFGYDRLCAILGGSESIRDFIAFPKNNAGRDVMLDAPAPIDQQQLNELHLQVKKSK